MELSIRQALTSVLAFSTLLVMARTPSQITLRIVASSGRGPRMAARQELPTQVAPMNVVLVVMDDVGRDQLAGYSDLNGYTGSYPYAYTPNLDAMISGGLRFTQFRVAPMCSPSRSQILTGQYAFRNGCGDIVTDTNSSATFRDLAVSPSPLLACLPSILTAQGVNTAAIGKWHLALDAVDGGTMPSHPTDLGFGMFEGTPRNVAAPPYVPQDATFPRGYLNYWWLRDGKQAQTLGEYLTTYTRVQAQRWMKAHAQEPFFLYLPFNACHGPIDAENWPPKGRATNYRHGFTVDEPDGVVTWSNTRLRASLEALDWELGVLRNYLDELGLPTLWLIIGDNGTSSGNMVPETSDGEHRYPVGHPSYQSGDESAAIDVSGYDVDHFKGTVYESGIQVPLIAYGPPVDGPGRDVDDLVDGVDLFRTICGLFGVSVPTGVATDSVDQSALITDDQASGVRAFSFSERFTPNGPGALLGTRTLEQRAYVRKDGAALYKLVRSTVPSATDELYELVSDPQEATDLGTGHAEYQDTADALDAHLASS